MSSPVYLRLLVQEHLQTSLKVDVFGHHQGGKWFREHVLIDAWYWLTDFNEEQLQALLKGETFDPVEVKKLGCRFDLCGECGAFLKITFDGSTLRFQGPNEEPCPHPDGLPEYSFEIEVPSGRLVVANDLRSHFKEAEDEDVLDMETHIGSKLITLAYAKFGMAYAFVGNSCPGVYQIGQDRYTIAVSSSEEGKFINPEGERVARICTDLWWYSLADEDLLKKRGYKPKKKNGDPVLTVTPGRYRFTHRYHLCDHESRTASQIYATFERVTP